MVLSRCKSIIKSQRFSRTIFFSLLFFLGNSTFSVIQLSNQETGNLFAIMYLLLGMASLSLLLVREKFNFWFLIKLMVTYIVYQILSYVTLMTFHINDADFKWNNFTVEKFEGNYSLPVLFVIGVILVIVILHHEIKGVDFIIERHVSRRENYFISQFLTAFIISDSKFINMLEVSRYFKFDNSGERLASFFNYLIIYILFSLGTYLFVKGITDLINNRVSISSAFSMSLLFALLFNYTVQAGISNQERVVDQLLFRGAFSLQMLLYTLLFLLIYLLTNRFLLSTLFIFVAGTIFSVANALKFSMRNEPILPSDLGWIKQIGLVLGFVNSTYLILSLIGFLGVGVLYYFICPFIWVDSVTFLKRTRLGLALLSVFSIHLVFQGLKGNDAGKPLKDIPIISTIDNTINIKWMGNAVNAQMKSLSYVWIKQMVTPVMEKPKSYSKVRVQEVVQKYTNLAKEINQTRTNTIKDRTVIYILSESFADPRRVPGVTVTGNMLPHIDALKETYTSGLMKSDGYGGGTANMEFQALTSLPMYNMSSNISTIYTEVATGMRFIPSISDLYSSDNRVVVHLENGANYSRNSIYKNLGFSKFVGRSNTDTKVENVEKIGLYPSDKSSYSLILGDIEASRSQFFSLITMQNHVPWSMDNPVEIHATKDGFTEEENASLTSYVRLLNQTDQATKTFLEKLAKIDKKISVVFYGDHLPSLYQTEDFKTNPELQYQTDYFIWSNDDATKVNLPILNSSDLTAALLESTKSKVSPYYALLTQVMQHRDSNSTSIKNLTDDLKVIEYDILNKKGYLDKNSPFFTLGG